MSRSRLLHLLVVVALVSALGALAPEAALAAPAQQTQEEGWVGEGLYLRQLYDDGPVTSVSVHAQPGAPVDFVPVMSGNRVGGGREPVSVACQRSAAVVCVNANFATCPSCPQPFGGIVRDGVLVRSPTPFQDQVSVIDGSFTLYPWVWSAGLQPVHGGEALEVDGVNVSPGPDSTVIYTRDYGGSTGASADSYELVVSTAHKLWTGIGVRQRVGFVRAHTGGDAPIPEGGIVVSARGAGADALSQFVEDHGDQPVDLVTNTPDGLEQSFAGHPILLRDGHRQPMDPADGKVRNRHPRTLLGWDDQGSVWVVVVDGRQPHSRGVTLEEATDHLLRLGARHAVNLDGGGSSTMVTGCPSESGWCVRNRPSDGHERRVPVTLALRPAEFAPPGPPAAPEPAQPAPEAPAEAPDPAPAEDAADEPSSDGASNDAGSDGASSDRAGEDGGPEPEAAPEAEQPPPDTGERDEAPPPTTSPTSLSTTTPTTASDDDVVGVGDTRVAAGALERDDGRWPVRPGMAALAGVLVVLEALAGGWLLFRRRSC